jgi:hypothetical protein
VAGSVSTVVRVLAERGLLADTTPVAEYWPEFAAHGKQTITVAHVLAHTAGVPQAPTGTTAARADDSPFFRAAPRAMQPAALLGNQPEYLTLDIPTARTMTAAAVARMYAALIGEVDSVWLITPDRLTRVSTVVTADTDRVLGAPIPKGLGYFLALPEMGPTPACSAARGSGGSIAFVDPGGTARPSPSPTTG